MIHLRGSGDNLERCFIDDRRRDEGACDLRLSVGLRLFGVLSQDRRCEASEVVLVDADDKILLHQFDPEESAHSTQIDASAASASASWVLPQRVHLWRVSSA